MSSQVSSARTRNSPAPAANFERDENNGADGDDDDIFRPSKRRKSTALFLDDPDEDGDAQRSPPTAIQTRPDIDAMFADLEDDSGAPAKTGQGTSSKPFDLAAMRREAQARAAREAHCPGRSRPQD